MTYFLAYDMDVRTSHTIKCHKMHLAVLFMLSDMSYLCGRYEVLLDVMTYFFDAIIIIIIIITMTYSDLNIDHSPVDQCIVENEKESENKQRHIKY